MHSLEITVQQGSAAGKNTLSGKNLLNSPKNSATMLRTAQRKKYAYTFNYIIYKERINK
jgi:hypothetical protein